MSLHVNLTECHGRGPKDAREVFWVAACECGWTSDQEHTGDGWKRAKLEYRHHVEDALGAEAYYTAPVSCKNCGSEHTQGILVGTHVYENACQRCGTSMLEPDNEAYNEAQERSKRWLF